MVRCVTDTTLFTWSSNTTAVYLTTCSVLLHLTQALACRSVRPSVMPRWGQHYSRHWNLNPPAGHTSARYPFSVTNCSEPTDWSWSVPRQPGLCCWRFDSVSGDEKTELRIKQATSSLVKHNWYSFLIGNIFPRRSVPVSRNLDTHMSRVHHQLHT